MSAGRGARLALVTLALVTARNAAAQAPATPPEPAPPVEPVPDEVRLAQAKELFRQGNSLRSAGDYERALDFFRRSRALVASVPNTLNAALCLDQLGRYDEALELYQELLTRFSAELTESDRTSIGPAMEGLRKRLGRLDVSSNVDGALLIGGRPRGTLPLTSPVPVMPGTQRVRVLKDGYETFEATVTLEAGATVTLDAKLKKLERAGKLRVDDPGLAGADLFVDGGMVGKLPWEGTLTPGRHLYFVRRGDLGSAPATAIVVEAQTVLVGVRAEPLGPDLAVVVEPATAELSIDGVPLGQSGFQGRLPIGAHTLSAREPGYVTETRAAPITRERAGRVVLRLKVDADHPRWASQTSGHAWVDAFGGPAFAVSLGSDAESACGEDRCSARGLVVGAMAGLRLGYELPVGVSFDLAGGILVLGTGLTREQDDGFGRPGQITATSYRYTDDIQLTGPFVAAGLGYRHAVAGPVGVGGRVHLGVAFPSARDSIEGDATANGRTVPTEVEGSGAGVRAAAFFAMPEIEARLELGKAHVGIGFAVILSVLEGPESDLGETRVAGQACNPNASPAPIDCAPRESLVAGERAWGPFIAWRPGVHVGYTF